MGHQFLLWGAPALAKGSEHSRNEAREERSSGGQDVGAQLSMGAWSSSTVPLQPLLLLGDSHTLLQAQAPASKVLSCLLSSH